MRKRGVSVEQKLNGFALGLSIVGSWPTRVVS
jgi:hypothetical protein